MKRNILLLKGIGAKTANLFSRCGVTTFEELLAYYPRSYEQFLPPKNSNLFKIEEITAFTGMVANGLTIKKVRNLTITNCTVRNQGVEIHLTFFNMPFLKTTLKQGSIFVFRGLLLQKENHWYMEHPKIYEVDAYEKLLGKLQPVYPLTAGLTNQMVKKAVTQVLEQLVFESDIFPEQIRIAEGLVNDQDARSGIHFPLNQEMLISARKRLVFEEFFFFLWKIRESKDHTAQLPNDYPMEHRTAASHLLNSLPYALTQAQKRVWQEIETDLASKVLMNRLIQGDVGSGKTILAILALCKCVQNRYQGAFMAPTEVLARQHMEALLEMTEQYHLPFKPVLLVGSMSQKEKRIVYEQIETGYANLIIGTHALIQERVHYFSLALVITDEQHRFGVRQREALAGKGDNVHVLVMSATPIPRTLAILLYGDLHISIVDELPANRLPIKNCVVNTDYRKKAYTFMEREISQGHQVYVICPMVEEGELEGVENVVAYTQKLKAIFSESIMIACLHGKMKPTEKNLIMEQFEQNKIQILVSTTVIEVGINVPNATLILIENAERFGLAQLHQLRGRVGRGHAQSYCIFISSSGSKQTMERLDILAKSNDGFHIAGEDLKLRGPGDLFGIRQSGELLFALGDIYQDAAILKAASSWVDTLQANTILDDEEYKILRKYLESKSMAVDFRSI